MRTIAVGTEKGGFLITGAPGSWGVRGPLFPGWRVNTWTTTAAGTHLAALGSNWFGASIHRSNDLQNWEQVTDGPAYRAEQERKLNQIWTFHEDDGRLLAGVDEAGLFTSDDDGRSWEPVEGLNEHETRPSWVPGLGGLAAHRVVGGIERYWVGISAVGVFHTGDGGVSFERRDGGIRSTVDESESEVPGFCIHSMVADPADPERMWRQDHSGVYRTVDGGRRWTPCETGLPAGFGFPIARDHASGRLFVVPLIADENRLPVDGMLVAYRSDDDGETWSAAGEGWSPEPTYTAVLRDAMTADQRGGVFFGTTGGTVWASLDAGDTWQRLPFSFPRILSVKVLG